MPLNKETQNIINIKNLKEMKSNSFIINTSRGGIINENDLNTALNEDIIAGAGLDVFADEPPNKNNPLLKNPKVKKGLVFRYLEEVFIDDISSK